VLDRLDRHDRADPAVRFGGASVGYGFRGRPRQPGHGGGCDPDQRVGPVQVGPEVGQVSLPVTVQPEARGHGELLVEHAQVEDLVDPVGPRPGTRHQVPAPGLEDQPVRFQPPVDVGRILPPPVADLQHAAVPDRAGDSRQQRHLVGRRVPAGGVEVKAGLDPPDLVAELGRQGRQQFELRRRQHRAEPQVRRGPGQAGQDQRPGLVGAQAGQPGAVAVEQLVAAAVPGVPVQRDAGLVQRLHVAVDGADRDLELGGELRGGHPPPGLEQEQEGDEPARAHVLILRHSTDNGCQGTDPRVRP